MCYHVEPNVVGRPSISSVRVNVRRHVLSCRAK